MGTNTRKPKIGDTVRTADGQTHLVAWANGWGWLRLDNDTRVHDTEVTLVSAPKSSPAPSQRPFWR